MQKNQKEKRDSIICHSGLCEIINPETITNLNKYCTSEEIIINLCYGYAKPYCPKTCNYAKRMYM